MLRNPDKKATFAKALLLFTGLVIFHNQGFAQRGWEQPLRSQANLDALERVETRSYDFTEANDLAIEYGVYVPTSYDESTPSPLVIALHGLGSGVDYMMVYNNLVELAESYGFLVATPMGYNERGWYGARGQGNEFNAARNQRSGETDPENLGELSEKDVMNVLAIMREDFNVNTDRIYLIGQSMGGGGTWYLGTKYPDIWAALAPMAPAAYMDTEVLTSVTHLPVMVVMGDDDQLVDVNVTRQWVAKMQELGMNYEYIEVAGGTHASAGRRNIARVFEFLNQHSKELQIEK